MLQRLDTLIADFPRQFWILFGGTLVNSIGSGMIFPFLTLYLHQHLNLSMTYVGVLLAFWSVSSLVGQLVGGSFADRFGRKYLMAASLGANAVVLAAFGFADSFSVATIIVILTGFIGSLFQPARDAMVADLVGAPKRPQAYGLMRMVANLGIAIGPAIGGLLAARSYLLTFLTGASTTFLFFLITTFLMHETKPNQRPSPESHAPGNLLTVLRDTRFMIFCAAIVLCTILAAQMMAVLPVYMKDQFGLGESFFGWVMTTNAAMVVVLQFPITRATERVPRLMLTAAGAILYALGVGSIALASAFPHFVIAMVVYTFGEMVLVPTSTAVTADLAPQELRGRYMGILGLTWSAGFGIGPILGGLISDYIAPLTLWSLIAIVGLVAAFVFLALMRFAPIHAARVSPSE